MYWFFNLYLLGLGYKVFIYKNFIIFKLGFSHYIKLKIPLDILIFFRSKSKIILFSKNYNLLSNFISKLKSFKDFNFYKGKGITFFENISFFKLKLGKQQQY